MSAMRSAGAEFRAAVAAERPLQIAGAVNAYSARLAEAAGFRALYVSGGGVAAASFALPDLGITGLEDVLVDVRRITDASPLPVLVDVDTGWGGAFNIARTVRSMIRAGAGAIHMEDQVQQKRCGHRPGKAIVPKQEMVDRVKAAVDARTDAAFVVMARTDALALEGLEPTLDRAALEVYRALRRDGTQRSVLDRMQTREELYAHLDYLAFEQKLDELLAKEEGEP